MALDFKGSVYTWGCNDSGQLGVGSNNENTPVLPHTEAIYHHSLSIQSVPKRMAPSYY